LENRGAYSSDVLDASLRAVRHSNVYLGLFGSKFSDATAEEFREAVKYSKPCFIYVKKVTRKDDILEKFIDDEIKSRFKYHPFRTNIELIKQVESDLRKFVLETLRFGIEVRSRKKAETQALIKKEENVSTASSALQDLLCRAESAYTEKRYLECLVVSSVILETSLKEALQLKGIEVEKLSIGMLVRSAAKINLISSQEAKNLQEISYIRNKAVHMGELPNELDVQLVLNRTKLLAKKLDNGLSDQIYNK